MSLTAHNSDNGVLSITDWPALALLSPLPVKSRCEYDEKYIHTRSPIAPLIFHVQLEPGGSACKGARIVPLRLAPMPVPLIKK